MASNPIRNRSGRPRKWRGRKSVPNLFKKATKKGDVMSFSEACRRIQRHVQESQCLERSPTLNVSRVKRELKSYVSEERPGIGLVVAKGTNAEYVVRRDSVPICAGRVVVRVQPVQAY